MKLPATMSFVLSRSPPLGSDGRGVPPPLPDPACPWLPRELVESILSVAAKWALAPPTTASATTKTRIRLRSGHAVGPTLSRKVQMFNFLMVISDLHGVARLLLPLLRKHAWPPERAAELGRLDALEKARSLGLLADHYRQHGQDPVFVDRATKLIHGAVYEASRNGHVHVVRWYFQHWPDAVQSDSISAQFATIDASALPGNCAVQLLDFWFQESGVLDMPNMGSRQKMTSTLLGSNARLGLQNAFGTGHTQVIAWWAAHSHLSPFVQTAWSLGWIDKPITLDKTDVLDLCAQLDEAGSVTFSKAGVPDRGTDGSNHQVSHQDTVRFGDIIKDKASALGSATVLEWWKQRQNRLGKPLVFTEDAIHDAASPGVLE